MRTVVYIFCVALLSCVTFATSATNDSIPQDSSKLVYKINIKENIMPAAWRQVQSGFEEASQQNADIVLIHMNTYGGMVDMADSIRTKILNSPIPVWVFIDNQAASAGALISIACDSIYMRKGASIGAATVVDQSGNVVPDKFQSFMRSTMRATAEAQGKVWKVENGDSVEVWRRDPRIAEAMVDPSVYIEGIIDTGKVLTFTTEEALRFGYCEGKAESVSEIFQITGIEDYTIAEFKPTFLDRIIGLLTNPVVSGILIMVIVGGIYFELQTPGVGFPLAAAILAAVIYFAPLYLEGLAQHYEVIIFIIGLALIAVEIFAIPGFGVTGISGIILVIIGLTLAMIDNDIFRNTRPFSWIEILRPLVVVSVSLFTGLIASIVLSRRLITSPTFPGLALNSSLTKEEGYVGIDTHQKDMVGKEGVAQTVLRPSGKVEIENEIFDAVSEEGYIDKGKKVRVVKDEAGQIYVMEV
ncbi:MAG TPA: NfeD family protein [Tenuifilaceae bacterium]|nr:NfeD family protein [Tenuifilaceae bacterium]HPJ47185.1 NfeD family protein [Tenuifilaceae bacterium]HPQ35817.1 NfeD family protein [Tenuifilaceae bacterium]